MHIILEQLQKRYNHLQSLGNLIDLSIELEEYFNFIESKKELLIIADSMVKNDHKLKDYLDELKGLSAIRKKIPLKNLPYFFETFQEKIPNLDEYKNWIMKIQWYLEENFTDKSQESQIDDNCVSYKGINVFPKKGKYSYREQVGRFRESNMRRMWLLFTENPGKSFQLKKIHDFICKHKMESIKKGEKDIKNFLEETKKNLIKKIAGMGILNKTVKEWFINEVKTGHEAWGLEG
ncbi:MAG: hypothetical protein NTZ25_00200 [Candidatus Peregrinibacteria bacterium]|nr:hypothetical protein [Candidatus Peregrinibacteria bacterium]